jgi:hypothetical protein
MKDEIEFTPTPADLAAAARDMRPRNWGRFERLRFVLAGAVLTLLVFFLLAAYTWRTWDLFILRWEEIVAFALGGGVVGWLYGGRVGLVPAGDPRLAARRLSISGDGFAASGTHFATKVDWAGVATIVNRRDTILIVTDWQESFFIPKRIFPDSAAAEAFRTRAAHLWWARRKTSVTARAGR